MVKLIVSVLLSLSLSTAALADKLPGNIAIHITKQHYEHPVRLLHPYLAVWHMKGPPAEKVALKALSKQFSNVNMCSQSKEADVVLLIEPQMFYNAQLRVFYAEFIVKAFANTTQTDNLIPITAIKMQAQQNGELSVKPEYYMEKAYTKAMDKVMKQLLVDKAFLDTLNKTPPNNAEILCTALDALPISRIYF